MAQLYTQDMNKVIGTINGVPVVGWAADAVSIETDGEEWTKEVGADGTTTRVRTPKPGGKFTLRLHPGSPTNRILRLAFAADKLSSAALLVVMVTDLLNGIVLISPNAWVVQDPGASFGNSLTPNEWVLDCGNMRIIG